MGGNTDFRDSTDIFCYVYEGGSLIRLIPFIRVRKKGGLHVLRFQLLYHPARVSSRDAPRRYTLHHHAAGSYYRPAPDGHTLQYDAARPDEHVVLDSDGGALGCVVVHRLLGGEHLAGVTHAPVEVMGVGVHEDAVAADADVVADGDALLGPEARRRHPDVMPYLYHRLRPLRHDAPTLVAAEGVDVFVRGKDEVVAYRHLRLRMNIEVDMVEHSRPLAQVPLPDAQREAQPIVADVERPAEEAREVERFADEGT